MRNNQVSRILKVIHYLELAPNGISVNEIHSKLERDGFSCTSRTIYRDLEAVQQAFLPVVRTGDDEDARWKLESVASLSRSVLFSYEELMALYLTRESLHSLRGTALFDHIDRFFSRIEKLLGSRAGEQMEEFRTSLGFKPSASWQAGVSQEILNTVHKACAEGHLIEIDYKSKSGPRADLIIKRRLGPESIYFVDSGVYLIAKDFESGLHKTYSLGRIAQAVMLDEAYESENFNSGEFFKHSLGVLRMGEVQEVVLHVSEPMATYVSERRWHESQQITRVPDGIELRMRVHVNDELARWVLGLGPAAVVVGPAGLRASVGALARLVAERYAKRSAA